MRVTAGLIRQQGEALQSYPIAPERAAELARELEILRASVVAAAADLDFCDEPSRHRAILEQNAETPRE